MLVEHYVSDIQEVATVGNIYLDRVQNVLPSMEAAFVDIGQSRNGVLYAGEVNWDATRLEGQPRRIELAFKSGDPVLVQVTKDPIGHKGARLTSQVTLAGRFLVLVPSGGMTGVSRKLSERERSRLKGIVSKIAPKDMGVIIRTAVKKVPRRRRSSRIWRAWSRQWGAHQRQARGVLARQAVEAAAGRAGRRDPRGARHLQRQFRRANRRGRQGVRAHRGIPRHDGARSQGEVVQVGSVRASGQGRVRQSGRSMRSSGRAWSVRCTCLPAGRSSSTAPRP